MTRRASRLRELAELMLPLMDMPAGFEQPLPACSNNSGHRWEIVEGKKLKWTSSSGAEGIITYRVAICCTRCPTVVGLG